jgi:hypothetical protein
MFVKTKLVKRFALIFSISIVLVLGTIISIPFFFKDEIKSQLLHEIDQNVHASVSFSDISFSTFRNFPFFTLTLHDVVVMGKDAFVNDTLVSSEELRISLDVKSVIQGHKINIKRIQLAKPHISILILEDSTENFNILIPDDPNEIDTDTSAFELNINKWEIEDGRFSFKNKLTNVEIYMNGLNHTGKGNIKEIISEFNLHINVDELKFIQHSITYLSNKTLNTDMDIQLDMSDYRFTFKHPIIKINEFAIAVDGYFKILEYGIDTDMRFEVEETSFDRLLSVLPGILLNDIKQIKTNGDFVCNGFLKGIYDSRRGKFPHYQFNLDVVNSKLQYPKLRDSIHDIHFSLIAENKFGIPDSMHIAINKLHLKIGDNPIDGYLKIKGYQTQFVEANLKASLDLADLEHIYPIDSLILKGLMAVNIQVKGVSKHSDFLFPFVDVQLSMDSGYVKSVGHEIPIEAIMMNVEVFNTTGKAVDTRILLNQFKCSIDNEPLVINGVISDLTDPLYDVSVDGLLDFEKLVHIFPVEGVSMSGELDTQIKFKGRESDIEKKNYTALRASGTADIKNLSYISHDFSNGLSIKKARLEFTPEKIVLESCKGKIDKSTFLLSGYLYDYMAIVLNNHDLIQADLNLKCDTLNLNHWLDIDTTAVAGISSFENDTSTKIVQFPTYVDVSFDSNIGYLTYGTMEIKKLIGHIRVKNGIMSVHETSFETADATFKLMATYDPRNALDPIFNLLVDIKELEIKKAYGLFYTIQAAAPSAKNTNGVFSTLYTLRGSLDKNHHPVLSTLEGSGSIVIRNAELNGVKVLKHLSRYSKKHEMDNPAVTNLVLDTKISKGRVYINTVEFMMGKYLTEIEGSCSFDSDVNYLLHVGVPPLYKIRIPVHITGNIDDPTIKIGTGGEKDFNFDDL